MIVELFFRLIMEVIGCFIAGGIEDGIDGARNRRRRYVFGLRVVSGTQEGLSSEWLVGEWRVRRGRLIMGALTVPITETVGGTRRMAKPSEIVGGVDTIVVTVRTGTAVLDWSMSRRLDGLALRALGVVESPADPRASDHNRLSAREAAEHIRWGLTRSDEKYAIRYVAQTISDLRATRPDRLDEFLVEPETTGERKFDTLLATAIGWECSRQGLTPPAWTATPPLTSDWVVWPYGPLSARWAERIRARTPSAFAAKRIFVAENDLTRSGVG